MTEPTNNIALALPLAAPRDPITEAIDLANGEKNE